MEMGRLQRQSLNLKQMKLPPMTNYDGTKNKTQFRVCRVKGQTVSEMGGGLTGIHMYVCVRVEEDRVVFVK